MRWLRDWGDLRFCLGGLPSLLKRRNRDESSHRSPCGVPTIMIDCRVAETCRIGNVPVRVTHRCQCPDFCKAMPANFMVAGKWKCLMWDSCVSAFKHHMHHDGRARPPAMSLDNIHPGWGFPVGDWIQSSSHYIQWAQALLPASWLPSGQPMNGL